MSFELFIHNSDSRVQYIFFKLEKYIKKFKRLSVEFKMFIRIVGSEIQFKAANPVIKNKLFQQTSNKNMNDQVR